MLKANDDKKYESLVLNMTQEEEMLIQNKLMDIIDRLGLTFQDFQ